MSALATQCNKIKYIPLYFGLTFTLLFAMSYTHILYGRVILKYCNYVTR